VAKESSVGFAFWYQGSGLAKLIQGNGTGNAKAQEKQADRDAKVSRIQIFPGDVTVDLSDPVRFSAVAYDRDGDPVGGVKIKWSGHGATAQARVRISPHGEFEATTPGSFTITAQAGGKTAQVTVTVRAGLKRDLKATPTGTHEVSSRDVSTAKIASVKEQKKSEGGAGLQFKRSNRQGGSSASRRAHASTAKVTTAPDPMPQGGGGGWGDSNYWSAGRPENRVADPPGATVDGGAGSGNFQFAAPVVSMPGRGVNISLGLAYNSRLWNKANSQINYDNDRGWPAPGFNLGFGKLLGMGVYNGGMLVDADGTRHSYTGNITFYNWGTYGVMHTIDGSLIDYTYWTGTGGGLVSAQVRLPNGTVINYGAAGPGAIYPTFIEDPNGNYISITYVNNAGPRIQTVTDTLNRTISFSYDYNNLLTAITAPGYTGGTRTVVRLHYHQLALSYGFSGLTPSVRDSYPWVVDAIYYPGTSTGYWLNDSDSYSSYGMLAKVVEERGMGFSASSLNDMGSASQGAITRRETYNYPLTPDYSLTDAPTYPSVLEEWTRDGVNFDSATTGYEVHENDNPRTTTITLPNGTKSKQYSYNASGQYNDGLVYHDVTYVSDENSPLQSSNSYWEQGAYNTPRPTRVEKTDERGQTTAAAFSYGSVYNQVTEVRNYDYGGSSLLRATRTTYQNSTNYTGTCYSSGCVGRHIFNLPSSVEVYAADYSTRVARTEYQYDGQSLSAAPNVVMHDQAANPHAADEGFCYTDYDWNDGDCTGSCNQNCPDCIQDRTCDGYCPQIYVCPYDSSTDFRGNVTQVTSYADAINLGGAVTETRRYDITGNLVTGATSSEQTSFNYSVDTQYTHPLSKTQGSATDAYAQVTTSATYDFYTGLGLSATDVNGRQSQASYDTNTLRPTTSVSPTGAHTDFAYDDAAMTVTSTTYPTAGTGGAIADQSVKMLNGAGQVRVEKARGPDSGGNQTWDEVDTIYNNLGQVSQQSRPYRVGTETPVTSTVAYDALGRTVSVTAPDGGVTQTFYNEASRPSVASSSPGETTRMQDSWGRERWGRTDASGRLVEVVEPDPSGGGSVASYGLVTTYSYNTLGNLTQTNQGAQTRSFKYDSLGRLNGQKLAEQNATLNDAGTYVGSGTWSDVFTYDDRSNLTSRTDARGVKTVYTYSSDPLNRLQSVSWDTSGFGDTANPILSAATVSYQYRTKASPSDLTDVTQLASVTASGVSTETYAFDTEARVSSKTLTLTSRPYYPMVTDYTFDTLDRVTDVRYPAEYGNGSAPRKVVHHDYDIASRLSGLTYDSQSFASSIVYNAASQTTSLSVGTATNQVNESYTYNAQTGLLDSQSATRGSTPLLNLSYDYTNSSGKRTGQLTKISNNQDHNKDRGYEYDALGRLQRATGGQNVNWVQRYNYDSYGNRSDVWSYTGDQYVKNLYQSALNRQPNSTELQTALSSLQSAYSQGQSAFLTAMQGIGETVFGGSEYAGRNRSNHDYVYDLYKAYLYREPDAGGWAAWEAALNNGSSRADVRSGFAWSAEFQLKIKGVSPYAPPNNGVVPPDGLTALGFDSASNRINSSGFAYDAAGNQTRALIPGSTTISQRFQYDAANRMVKVKADDNSTVLTSYTYGSSNERLMAEEGSLRTYYDCEGGSTVAEYIESGGSTTPAWSKSYLYLDERLLSTLTPNGSGGEAVQYHHPDRLGTRLVTDPSSGSSFEQVALPFGTALESESSGQTNRRFTSYDRSTTTKLDYAVNRHYDSQQGRFTQVDPAGMSATSLESPQTLNLYAYCANDPINQTDPSGLGFFSFLKKVFKWVVVAVTVVVAVLTIIYTGQIWAAVGWVKMALGLIAAVANAASSVLTALGVKTAGMIFDIIAAGASFGISLANIAGHALEKVKTIFKAIQDGATLASKTLTALGHKMAGQIFDLVSTVAGFISSEISKTAVPDPKHKGEFIHEWKFKKWDIYKFVRAVIEKGANLAGAERLSGFVNVLGLVDDTGDIIMGIQSFGNAAKGGPLSKSPGIPRWAGWFERSLPLLKKVNTAFGRIDKAVALAH
jgi:RHS repeat-associated protein